MEAVTLKKYPRTPHLEGSRLQPGGAQPEPGSGGAGGEPRKNAVHSGAAQPLGGKKCGMDHNRITEDLI